MTRATDGKISDSVRRTQALPLTWDIPAAAEIDNLKIRLWKLTDRRRGRPAPIVIEGAILLVLCMQTGESSRALCRALRGISLPSPTPSLFLTSAEGQSTIVVKPSANAEPIHLPQTILLTRLLAMQPPISEPYGPVFNCSRSDVEDAAFALIRGGVDWRSRSPKAARSLLAHSRWLFRRLREVSKGDPALVAILKPDHRAAEQTLTAYCAVPHEKVTHYYRRAIRPLGAVSSTTKDSQRDEQLTGRAKIPCNDQLRQDILRIGRRLAHPMITANKTAEIGKLLGPLPVSRDWHLSMMAYTYILATFGTGQRSKKPPCGEKAIDRESGFAWVVEKGNAKLGLAGERGVFHCWTVREQLERYEDYLNTLVRMLKRRNERLASKLQKLRGDDAQLVFFDIRNDKVYRLSPYQLCEAAGSLGWKHDAALGRRWLRSQLTAEIPSDALAAQFGHNLDGLDVWSQHSGLQVRDLPFVLGPAIERTLSDIGLEPLSARTPKRRCKVYRGPDTHTFFHNSRECSGQVFASLIWNGALLQRDKHEFALEALAVLKPSNQTPSWILLDENPEDTKRWLLDPISTSLIEQYREAGRKLSPKFDKVIEAYFKCKNPCEQCPNSCKKAPENYAEFVTDAMTRWRYRLPPILYAKAIGTFINHELPDDQCLRPVDAGSTARNRPDSSLSYSATALSFIAWLKGKNSNTSIADKSNKLIFYKELSANLAEQRFWIAMPMLERWLTSACIEQLVAYRGKQNTTGYSLSTIIKRAEQVFGYFAIKADGKYNDVELNKWPLEEITRVIELLPKRRVQANVASELAALVKAYYLESEKKQVLEMLEGIPQNHRSFVVAHDLYRKIIASDDRLEQRAVLALCYKAGVRLSELHSLSKDMFADDGATFTLRLDHKPKRRLKTFYSRRIIPLDVLLDEDEQQYLRDLLQKPLSWLFPLRDRAERLLKDSVKLQARPLEVSAWALRHSFATNAYAALLWPESEQPVHAAFFDPAFISGRNALRNRLCGKTSLGAIGPHALATVMGHTSPSRTLFSYAHNLEFILAAHVATWQKNN